MDNDFDMELEDDDAFEGPDAIVEGDEDVPENPNGGPNVSIQDILSSLYEVQDLENATDNDSSNSPRTVRRLNILISRASGLWRAFRTRVREEDEDVEDNTDEYLFGNYRRTNQWFPSVTEPQQAGLDLLMSGDFGRVRRKTTSRRKELNIARIINNPPIRFRAASYIEDIACNLVPNSNGTAVATYESNIYSGQFSADSSFYYTCAQDFRLRVYDMIAPPMNIPSLGRRLSASYRNADPGHQSTMKVIKTIQGHEGRWTVTDSHLSPDNHRIIYSSITPTVYMANTLDSSATQIPITFSDSPRDRHTWISDDSFGIWSCRFSADGNEVVAGGNGRIFVYDLLANRRTVKISAHDDDVNSCCWADATSGNVLISASDDTFLKVWDRRSLGTSRKPSGVLIGHTEGITYVSAKGDGRYVISNGKDQALRLWDLRKMRSSAEFDVVAGDYYGSNFDYRYNRYPKPKHPAHPQDCSVMTYRGHAVLRTLIRCHFSPVETTGAQYLYSGSADGKIHIWSLDGRVVQVLDRSRTLPISFDPSGPEPEHTNPQRVNVTCVRDVSWHSQEPMMMSVGWESVRGGSVVARHEWKGLSKMPGALEDWVARKKQERLDNHRQASLRRVPGAFESDED